MQEIRVLEKADVVLTHSVLFNKAQQVARAAQKLGGRALLVGGYVRDALLNLSPKDADMEVYGLEAGALRQMLSRLGRVNCVGESFRVYKLVWHDRNERHELDVSLPRRDRKTGVGHRGFEVEGDPNASFEDAARRRDFTINAILCDPLSGEIIDPFGGRADLHNRVLKAVDAAHFAEDSLRVLRAMQMAARFEMTIDRDTIALCRSIDLNDLPHERIWSEWEKMLLKSARPSLGLRAAHELRVLEKLFPALETTVEREGENVCRTLDKAAEGKRDLLYEKQVTLMLAALSIRKRDNAETLLDLFGLKTLNNYDVRAQVAAILSDEATPREFSARRENVSDGELRRVATRCEPKLLYHLARAQGDVEAAEWFIAKMRELGVENGPPAPLLMGRHLLEMGMKPGPRIGEITRAVYELQLDGDITNEDEAKAAAQRMTDET